MIFNSITQKKKATQGIFQEWFFFCPFFSPCTTCGVQRKKYGVPHFIYLFQPLRPSTGCHCKREWEMCFRKCQGKNRLLQKIFHKFLWRFTKKSTICIMKTLLYFVLFSFWLTWERARKLCCIFIKEGWWAVWKVISENTGRTP